MSTRTRSALLAVLLLGAPAARAESPVTGSGESFRINGYLNAEYERLVAGESNRADKNGSFDADMFDLVFNWAANDRLRMAADLTWEHGAAIESGFGNVAVEYAFTEYAFADFARIRVGKMLTPFGIYNEIHTAKPAFLTVKEPFSTARDDKFGNKIRFYPRWGSGLAVLGNGSVGDTDWDYVVMISNGDRPVGVENNPYDKDDNRPKAATGRVRATLFSQLEVGASVFYDKRQAYTGSDPDKTPTDNQYEVLSWGAQATWRLPDPAIAVELEYIGGTVNYMAPLTTPTLQRQGYAAMASWTFFDRLTPYARYEYLDPNTDGDDDQAAQIVYGVNYKVAGGLILKGDLSTVRAGDNNPRYSPGNGDYTELKLGFVLGF